MSVIESRPGYYTGWFCGGAFVVLFITGLILFLPPLGFLAQDSWPRIVSVDYAKSHHAKWYERVSTISMNR